LIPIISWFFLLGKCSSCRARISPRYPLTEFLNGAIWAALFWRIPFSFELVSYAALCSVLLAVFFIDLDYMRIPNALVLCAMVPALALSVRYAFFLSGPGRFRSVYNSVDAAAPLLGLAPSAFFLAVYMVTSAFSRGKNAIGMGDIKLLIPAGFALGLRQCAFAAFIGILLGGAVGAVLLITGIKKRKDPIPFGPFLVTGVIAAIFIPASIFL